MNHDFQHLLTKYGILTHFNIARKIKPSYIKALEKKLKKSGKSDKEIDEEVNKKIIINTQKFVDKNEIPGLYPTDQEYKIDLGISDTTRKKILYIANKATDYCKKYNFSKDSVIFLIQIILHYMKITNEDMNRFKEKYNINNDSDDDYLDNEDDEF
jgi:hypothetical protein